MAASKKPNLAKYLNGGRFAAPSGVFWVVWVSLTLPFCIFFDPTNAYAILAAIFKQEFKHPKFKHPNGIPKVLLELRATRTSHVSPSLRRFGEFHQYAVLANLMNDLFGILHMILSRFGIHDQ